MPNPRFDRITRSHVIAAARSLAPKRIQKWSCVVSLDGTDRAFPVKQLFMAAANQILSGDPPATPADFIPHFAASRLRKLGFTIQYSGSNGTESASPIEGGSMISTFGVVTVPERVLAFLVERSGLPYCDDCIAKHVGINRHMAHQSTLPFGLTRDFKRAFGRCAGCGESKLVIAFLKS